MCEILVVDDDEQMRAMLAASLESHGYVVGQAGGALALFEHLEGRPERLPSLLICDYRMPGTDGLQVIERIKNEYPMIEIILITAFGDEEIHRRARTLGAAAVFNKPFDLASLHRDVEALLR